MEINFVLIIAIIAVLAISFVFFKRKRNTVFEMAELQFDAKIFKGKYKIERNYENLEIAHRIYTELITRKAAIPIEPEKDVIKEVYDSWYVLFKTTREEIKSLSGKSLINDYSDDLVKMATNILNEGLRPHLTTYQAKFRKWDAEESNNNANKGKSPQEIQQSYPEFEELIKSMIQVNELLIQYANELKKFITSNK